MRKAFIVLCGLFTVLSAWAIYRDSRLGVRRSAAESASSGAGTPQAQTAADRIQITRAGLQAIIESNRERVATNVGDGEAAVRLADALMRMARVSGDASLAIEAEHELRATLKHSSSDYMARRMLSVVYLSQHRFAEALEEARSAQKLRPADAWNYAIAGDALLELGRYDEAFDSFDKVMERRPDAGAYARVAYARELQGDLDGAVQLMTMSAEATSRNDAEALAWTFAQLGNLYLLQGRLDETEREFRRADYVFPSHPYAMNGRVRLLTVITIPDVSQSNGVIQVIDTVVMAE